MDDSRLTKSIFNYDYNLCTKNWSFRTKCLLEEIGLIDNFINKTPVDLEVAKMALIDKFNISWKEEVNNKPKLRTYIKLKKSAHVENYVLHCKDQYRRSMFAQFRSGILPIKLETGRFTNIPLDERVCDICSEGVESETHLLFDCHLY